MTLELCAPAAGGRRRSVARRALARWTVGPAALLVWLAAQSAAFAQPLAPTLTFPANNAVNADLSQPITWTTVANAQSYYLYVGTTVGATNLVNTGGLQTTSYLASGLPAGQTLYARIWAQVAGTWRYTDSTFSALPTPPPMATLTFPANGAVNADLSLPITWTTVANVQWYYLYIGTSVGAKDVVDSGGLQTTSYQAKSLPYGQTLFARLWTQVGGVWRYADSTFSVVPPVVPKLTYPLDHAVAANMSQPITWVVVPNAQAYYLYVGTTLGAKNLVDSGGTLSTSFQAPALPSGQTLYARIWAQVGGVWRYTDSTFTAAPMKATITFPVNGTVNADMSLPIQWTSISGAQWYYLYVGSTVGGKDLVDSGGTHGTSFQANNLPPDRTLYVRLWTQTFGLWNYVDSTFIAAFTRVPKLIYPANGAVNADMTQPFTWTPIANAESYYLYVGTSPGAKNLVDTGGILTRTYLAAGLPSGQTLYARVWAKVKNVWKYSDTTFSAAPAPLAATVTYPQNGALNADKTQSIQWTTYPGAQWYYLYVGTTPGAKNLLDTGGLHVTSFPATALPVGTTLYARLWTESGNVWRYVDSTFAFTPPSHLLHQANLAYQGAFHVPKGIHAGGQGNAGFEYGGGAISFNAANSSLFMVGHDWDQFVGEISIPTIGGTATLLQMLADPTEGKMDLINPPDPNSKRVGGTLPWNGALLVSGYSFYDGNSTQQLSHFVRPLSLSTHGQVTGPLRVGAMGAGFYSGYMGVVPPDWRVALGGPTLTGNASLPAISRTSYGPSVSVFDPAVVSASGAQGLVAYPTEHQTLGPWNASNSNWGGADTITGVVFPAGTSTVLFFGKHGATFCYGPGTDQLALVGTIDPNQDTLDPYCYDPAVSAKGQHGYPYASQVWAYDAHVLASVAAGQLQPWDVMPYAVWSLPTGFEIVGAAYDPATQRVFVSERFADGENPLVHVFQVQ